MNFRAIASTHGMVLCMHQIHNLWLLYTMWKIPFKFLQYMLYLLVFKFLNPETRNISNKRQMALFFCMNRMNLSHIDDSIMPQIFLRKTGPFSLCLVDITVFKIRLDFMLTCLLTLYTFHIFTVLSERKKMQIPDSDLHSVTRLFFGSLKDCYPSTTRGLQRYCEQQTAW